MIPFLIALRRIPGTNPLASKQQGHPIAWTMTAPILILFLQEQLGAGINAIAWAFLPSGLVWALLPARLGVLADRFGRKPLMVLGLMVSAGTMFLLPGLTSIFALTALWAILALCGVILLRFFHIPRPSSQVLK
jgi:MFS family permease